MSHAIMRLNAALALLPCVIVLGVACGSSGNGGSASPTTSSTAPTASAPTSTPTSTSTTPVTPPPADDCTDGVALCTAKDKVRACTKTSAGTRWVDTTCAAGSGCVLGACTPNACSDECTLGATTAGKQCAPWSVASGMAASPVDPTGSMHDRSRAYLGWMMRGPMLAGSIGSPHYDDPPTFQKLASMNGIGDSAIWTGTYLAAEAMRLAATGSSDARERVRSLTSTLHLFMNVSGEPGVLARWTKESGTTLPFTTADLQCPAGSGSSHCGVGYGGKTYDYLGHISRDQYQGVMLGYSLAYEALGPADEATRALIREDVVVLVLELMKERSVPATITVNGVPVPGTVKLRFVVLDPREMTSGKIAITLDTSNTSAADMAGFQEFTPNLADIIHQLPGLSWVPSIPRASSAIMLASFFRVALQVTDGVPAYAARRAAILDYYLNHSGDGGNVGNWLDVAKTFSLSADCGATYYGNNITWEPLYDLARLEDSPTYKSVVLNDVLKDKLWPPFATHKNSFFSFIYAGNVPGGDAAAVAAAVTQLGQFPPPPRVQRAVDLRSSPKYPSRDSSCTDQVAHTDAIDVADRPTSDFLWQRHPWSLYDAGDPGQVQPGVDYLAAYWLGRRHSFLTDDSAGVCLAWQ